jgi:hypothetical protein
MALMLINGCSHTAGSEIEYTNQPFCYDKSWGKWLTDMCGDEYVNISRPGAGNEYICRTTKDWIIENVFLSKSHNKEDLHVIVMWSGFDRKEIYYPDSNHIDSINPLSKPKVYTKTMQHEMKKLQEVIVYFYDNLYSSLKNIIILNDLLYFLNTYEIKYTFLNALNPFITLQELNNEHKKHVLYQSYYNNLWVFNEINKGKHFGIFNKDETFFHHLNNHKDFKWSKFSELGHFGEDGHKYWAEKVYKYIFNNKSINNKKLV